MADVLGVDTATAIAIAVPGVSALAILAGYRQVLAGITVQRELAAAGVKAERQLADLAAVRAVLDDAAVALHLVSYTLDSVRLRLTTHGPAGFFDDGGDGSKLFEKLRDQGAEVDALVARLAIRFGEEHEVAKTYAGATEAVLDIFRALELISFEEPDHGDPYAREQIAKMGDEQRERITEQRAIFDDQRPAFVKAAVRRSGARLDED
jgi:hypothetical protein